MTTVITDAGFGPDTWAGPFVTLPDLPANDATVALHLPADTDPATLAGRIDHVALIRIDFPSFADGRGFTIARALRLMGYTGRLRAHGHVIADQYAMARRAGFDEVEIDAALAARQPEDHWLTRAANWTQHSYQARLRG